MSLPELFQHRDRFVGCLTLRRLRSPRAEFHAIDPLWLRSFHPLGKSGYWLLLATRAYDEGVPRCLEASQSALELDRRFWGDAIHRLLPLDLLESSLVPSDGCLSISIAPVLMVIARVSQGCRDRCLAYLEAQTHTIGAALARTPTHAGEAQRQLAGFADNAEKLRQLLSEAPPTPTVTTAREAHLVEYWLDTGDLPDGEKRVAASRGRDEYFASVSGVAETPNDARVAVLRTR